MSATVRRRPLVYASEAALEQARQLTPRCLENLVERAIAAGRIRYDRRAGCAFVTCDGGIVAKVISDRSRLTSRKAWVAVRVERAPAPQAQEGKVA